MQLRAHLRIVQGTAVARVFNSFPRATAARCWHPWQRASFTKLSHGCTLFILVMPAFSSLFNQSPDIPIPAAFLIPFTASTPPVQTVTYLSSRTRRLSLGLAAAIANFIRIRVATLNSYRASRNDQLSDGDGATFCRWPTKRHRDETYFRTKLAVPVCYLRVTARVYAIAR